MSITRCPVCNGNLYFETDPDYHFRPVLKCYLCSREFLLSKEPSPIVAEVKELVSAKT